MSARRPRKSCQFLNVLNTFLRKHDDCQATMNYCSKEKSGGIKYASRGNKSGILRWCPWPLELSTGKQGEVNSPISSPISINF